MAPTSGFIGADGGVDVVVHAAALKRVDTQIGNILDMVRNSPALNGKTTIILTSDHGGHNKTHGDTKNPLDFTIPFYVWGAGVTAGE